MCVCIIEREKAVLKDHQSPPQWLAWTDPPVMRDSVVWEQISLNPDLQRAIFPFYKMFSGLSQSPENIIRAEPILEFWNPNAKLCQPGGGGGGGGLSSCYEWMKRICPCFHSNIWERVSLPQLAITCFFCLEQDTLWHSRYMIWLIFT